MKLHFGGKYKDESDLHSKREHPEGYVPFKEPSQKQMRFITFIACIAAGIFIGFVLRNIAGSGVFAVLTKILIGALIVHLLMIPHELIRAACYKEDVYFYINPFPLTLLVHGTEDMSRARFILMSILPVFVCGIIPFVAFLINHNLIVCGVVGIAWLTIGIGDYINIFNALTQMPRGAKTYFYGFHSFWYNEKDGKGLTS